MATTLGVAIASRQVALALVAQRRTGPVALDQVLLEPDPELTTPQQVLAEVQRIIAVLGTHKRPLSQIGVAATEAMAASTAISVVEALNAAGLDYATLVPPPSGRSLAGRHTGNPNVGSGPADISAINAPLTAAHEIALEALALIPDVSGHALGGVRTRRALAVGATAVVTVGVGLIGFRLLSGQSSPEVAPVQATEPVPTQLTPPADASPPPTSAVRADTTPAVVDSSSSEPTTAEVTARAPEPPPSAPPPAPTQESPTSSVEPPPTSQDTAPVQAPQAPPAPEPGPPTTSSTPTEPPPPPPPSPTSQAAEPPVPPAPAATEPSTTQPPQ